MKNAGRVGFINPTSLRGEVCRKYAQQAGRGDCMVGASGRQRVQEACLNWVLIKNPPKPLLDRFCKLVRPMFDLTRKLLAESDTLIQTRDLLLNRLISGKLRVDDLDIRFPPSMAEDPS